MHQIHMITQSAPLAQVALSTSYRKEEESWYFVIETLSEQNLKEMQEVNATLLNASTNEMSLFWEASLKEAHLCLLGSEGCSERRACRTAN